jgi:hypothetical protein
VRIIEVRRLGRGGREVFGDAPERLFGLFDTAFDQRRQLLSGFSRPHRRIVNALTHLRLPVRVLGFFHQALCFVFHVGGGALELVRRVLEKAAKTAVPLFVGLVRGHARFLEHVIAPLVRRQNGWLRRNDIHDNAVAET